MSKPVKEMIVRDYQGRFGDLSGAAIIDIRGIPANANNELRTKLQEKSIRVTVLKNTLARKAFDGTALEQLNAALDGPCALAYGAESVVDVARALVTWAKKIDKLELKGAVLDGVFFEGDAGVKELSKYPTREEAQANVVQLVLSPARNLMGAVSSPGGNLLGIVKEIQERLERGEEISKVA